MGALPGFSFSPFSPITQAEGWICLGVSPSWSAPAAMTPEMSVASGNHDPGSRPLPGPGLGWSWLGVVGPSRCSCLWLCSASSLWGLLSAWLWPQSKRPCEADSVLTSLGSHPPSKPRVGRARVQALPIPPGAPRGHRAEAGTENGDEGSHPPQPNSSPTLSLMHHMLSGQPRCSLRTHCA